MDGYGVRCETGVATVPCDRGGQIRKTRRDGEGPIHAALKQFDGQSAWDDHAIGEPTARMFKTS